MKSEQAVNDDAIFLLEESRKFGDVLANIRDQIVDEWITQIESEHLPHYSALDHNQLRAELYPTADQMIEALKTGDPSRVREHTCRIIYQRIDEGFGLPEIEVGLHALSIAVKKIAYSVIGDRNKRLAILQVIGELYYNVALIVADVYQKLQIDQQERFMSVYNLGLSLSMSLDVDLVIDTAINKISEAMHSKFTALVLYDHGSPIVRASIHLDDEMIREIPSICNTLGFGIDADIQEAEKPVCVINDVTQSNDMAPWRDKLISENCISIACVPLLYRGSIRGSIIVCLPTVHDFPDFEIDFLSALAVHSSIAIQNARSFNEEEKGRKELGLLLDISRTLTATLDIKEILRSMVRLTVKAVSADYAIVILPDQTNEYLHIIAHYAKIGIGGKELRRLMHMVEPIGFATDKGLIGNVYQSGEPVLIGNYQEYNDTYIGYSDIVKSAIIVPMKSRDHVIGLFLLISFNPDEFTEEELHLSIGVADQAASALENARLYDEARGKRELGLILEAGKLFTSTLDLNDILNKIVNLAVDNMNADFSFIMMPDDTGEFLMPVAGYFRNHDFLQKWTDKGYGFKSEGMPKGLGAPGKVYTTGQPLLVKDYDKFPEKLDYLEDVFGSSAIVPLKLIDEVLGVFGIVSMHKNTFDMQDLSLLNAIADQASVAIVNAKLYARQQNIAKTLQKSFLPASIPEVPGYEVAVRYSAALQEAEIGGDFYDIFQTVDSNLSIAIGDVSGKGLYAAVQTAMGKYTLRAYAAEYLSPVSTIEKCNSALYRYLPSGMFITLFYGILDCSANKLVYVDAGHDLPMRYSAADKKLEYLDATGPGLGIMENAVFDEKNITMQPGDVLLLYTDGATDVRQDSNFLTTEGLEHIFLESVERSAEDIADSVLSKILEYSNNKLSDDIAMIVLRRL
ncbi:MAG: SpoIIE family protein phosphatase [Armatimonadota bacterium]